MRQYLNMTHQYRCSRGSLGSLDTLLPHSDNTITFPQSIQLLTDIAFHKNEISSLALGNDSSITKPKSFRRDCRRRTQRFGHGHAAFLDIQQHLHPQAGSDSSAFQSRHSISPSDNIDTFLPEFLHSLECVLKLGCRVFRVQALFHVLQGKVVHALPPARNLGELVPPVLQLVRQAGQYRQSRDDKSIVLLVEIDNAPWWRLVNESVRQT